MFVKYIISILIIFSVVVPWVLLQYSVGEIGYIHDIKKYQINDEFLNKIKLATDGLYQKFQYSLFFNNERPLDWNFYVWTIFKGFFPWSMFVVISFIYAIRCYLRGKDKKLLSILFVATFLYIFISIKEQNWSRYAINFYPFLSIFVAKFLYDFYKNKDDNLLKIGSLLTFLFFTPFLIPYNFSYQYLGISYVVILSFLLLVYFTLSSGKKMKFNITAFLIILHFCVIALLNVSQPFLG